VIGLLDTHTFLRWITNDPQLSPRCQQIISDPSNSLYLSVASAWEIAIKAQIGKLPLSDTPEKLIPKHLALNSFQVLPIHLDHALHLYTLPLLHRDPFDRILVAQSQRENLPILTADSLIAQYGIQTVW